MGPSGTSEHTITLDDRQLSNKGQVLFNGQDLAALSRSELMQQRQKMGMLFQSGALFTDMSVFDNVAFRCACAATVMKKLFMKKYSTL